MTLWNPANEGQLTSGDPLGSQSCVAYSASYAVSHATGGVVHPTGQTIRGWTGDIYGGLELGQVDRAITVHTSVEPMTGVWTSGEFYGYVAAGWQALLIGGYAPIEASRFSGQPGFYRNHAIWVPPGLKAGDPLADGRRSGIYHYHGEAYPKSLISAFAAALRDSTGHNVGPNHFEASLIRTTALSSGTQVSVGHSVMLRGDFMRYYVDDQNSPSHLVPPRRDLRHGNGEIYDATGRYEVSTPWGTKRLAKIVSRTSQRAGWWINTDGDGVTYRRTA